LILPEGIATVPDRAQAEGEVSGLVSTVITSYNKGPYLAEAIDSALAQDYPRQEVLVIDDGSTDNTHEVAESYGDRIRYIRQENMGQPTAKNRGIREARGEFVAFLDGDDRWRPGKLSKQVEYFGRNPALGLVYTDRLTFRGEEVVDESGKRRGPYYRGKVLDRLLINMIIPFSSAVARRRCLIAIGMFDESLAIAPDFDLWLRLGKEYEIDYVDEVLVEYRIEAGAQRIGARHRNKFRITQGIQDRFIRDYYDGRYPNPRVVAIATANRYSVLGDYHLAEGRQLEAFGAYFQAMRRDLASPRRYYSLTRSLVPNPLAAFLKTFRRRRRVAVGPPRASGLR